MDAGADELQDDLLKYVLRVHEELMRAVAAQREGLDGAADAMAQGAHEGGPADEEDEVALLVHNALGELKGYLNVVARHPRASRLLEDFARYASDSDIRELVQSLVLQGGASRLSRLAEHRAASHVLESVFRCVSDKYRAAALRAGRPVSLDVVPAAHVLVDVAKLMSADVFMSMVSDERASHVVRTLINCMCGTQGLEVTERSEDDGNLITVTKTRSALTQNSRARHEGTQDPANLARPELAPDAYIKAIVQLADSLVELDMLQRQEMEIKAPAAQTPMQALCFLTSGSTALQTLLLGLFAHQSTEVCHSAAFGLAKVLVAGQLLDLCFNTPGSRLVECIVSNVPPDLVGSLYADNFKEHMLELAVDFRGNYVVQRLIEATASEPGQCTKVFKNIVEELTPHFETLFERRRSGVVLALLRACAAFGRCAATAVPKSQEKILKAIIKGLGGTGAEDGETNLFLEVLCMSADHAAEWRLYWADKTLEHALRLDFARRDGLRDHQENYQTPRIPTLGSLIVQSIVKLPVSKRKAKFSRSMQTLTEIEWAALMADRSGSPVVEVCLQERSVVPEKTQSILFEVIKKSAAMLCWNSCGSRVLECAYRCETDVTKKRDLVQELVTQEKDVSSSPYGSFVAKACHIHQFKSDPRAWAIRERSQMTRQNLLDDVLSVPHHSQTAMPHPRNERKRASIPSLNSPESNRSKVSRIDEIADALADRKQKDDVTKPDEQGGTGSREASKVEHARLSEEEGERLRRIVEATITGNGAKLNESAKRSKTLKQKRVSK
ncbi:Nucleolar protein 9 [Porphyridium purpureum]|uniref:Nucleolar protein 9 n=1 Tax=Porphyridium purpureum TaxID=35688 RepID=A0A5J4YZE4_PORPP|nr:Nucleolar protein 9 [Porphyridium purpureum]|eukprot:POR6947..scf208_2